MSTPRHSEGASGWKSCAHDNGASALRAAAPWTGRRLTRRRGAVAAPTVKPLGHCPGHTRRIIELAAFFIFLPFLVPVAQAYGWDLVWFGVIVTLNVAIGAFTPPTAVNLMVTCRIAGIPLESTFYWTLWMVFAMTAVLLLLTFVPEISLSLPRALGYL